MFDDCHKLHSLKSLVINGSIFVLCYFWRDDSIFSSDYRRCFVLLPGDQFSVKRSYRVSDLADFFISFALAKDLFSSEIFENSIEHDPEK